MSAAQPVRHEFGALIGVEPVTIPYRSYNPPIEARTVAELRVEQQVIVHCLYSRHHDGFVRQAHLEQVLGDERAWVIPFVLRHLGEYLIEIVEIIDRALATSRHIDMYRQFADANPDFVALTKQQATSYWNHYYRDRFLDRDDYPALRALSRVTTPTGLAR